MIGAAISQAVADFLTCGECGSPMTQAKARGIPVAYVCDGCGARHRCHPDGTPLGFPADAETRTARSAAHKAIDPLWQEAWRFYFPAVRPSEDTIKKIRKMARGRVYRWIEEKLGLAPGEAHMGSFDKETCERVVELAKGSAYSTIRTASKLRKAEGKGSTRRKGWKSLGDAIEADRKRFEGG